MPETSIQFSQSSLTVLNICLAIIMFGVALDIRWAHFTQLVDQKKAIATGLFAQVILLPALTILLISVLPISTGMALGLLLVACCPGGNVSNFFTQLAQGHVALSVTLTAFSSLSAFFITPLSFFLWGSVLPSLSSEIKSFEIDLLSLLISMVAILLIPLVVGMSVAAHLPRFAQKIAQPVRIASMFMLVGFIIAAVLNNQSAFVEHLGNVFWIVLLHNGLALTAAYYFSKALKNTEDINRTVAIETGIQNSGLALILIFTFFNGNTAMAVVAAWWGVWHLISGLTFASIMRNRKVVIQST
ncbi:MAG TPA: bile acid:sodium symporter family protein [Cyclobacteriaceae bacterium]|nr:bile acid:sodium symporter family protein [Cytophagales bacterium]HNT51155.1 bile acid:sodium symporter family protein [Cyclobacteriaceae bacterium]HRE68034.1 bile acid:sodium symporter family protein [Cyclobacteriaceae bacterium]HRF35157.1 bile acid:sodium symporter family protein [Cyclobacteriaceae bacterium]